MAQLWGRFATFLKEMGSEDLCQRIFSLPSSSARIAIRIGWLEGGWWESPSAHPAAADARWLVEISNWRRCGRARPSLAPSFAEFDKVLERFCRVRQQVAGDECFCRLDALWRESGGEVVVRDVRYFVRADIAQGFFKVGELDTARVLAAAVNLVLAVHVHEHSRRQPFAQRACRYRRFAARSSERFRHQILRDVGSAVVRLAQIADIAVVP